MKSFSIVMFLFRISECEISRKLDMFSLEYEITPLSSKAITGIFPLLTIAEIKISFSRESYRKKL